MSDINVSKIIMRKLKPGWSSKSKNGWEGWLCETLGAEYLKINGVNDSREARTKQAHSFDHLGAGVRECGKFCAKMVAGWPSWLLQPDNTPAHIMPSVRQFVAKNRSNCSVTPCIHQNSYRVTFDLFKAENHLREPIFRDNDDPWQGLLTLPRAKDCDTKSNRENWTIFQHSSGEMLYNS